MLAILLALCMALTLLPGAALAEENATKPMPDMPMSLTYYLSDEEATGNLTRLTMAKIIAGFCGIWFPWDWTPGPGNSGPDTDLKITDCGNLELVERDIVAAMVGAHYMSGTAGGQFNPDGSVTRAEAAAILNQIVSGVVPIGSAPAWWESLTDVPTDSWYYGPIKDLAHMGILTATDAYEDSTFRPDAPAAAEDILPWFETAREKMAQVSLPAPTALSGGVMLPDRDGIERFNLKFTLNEENMHRYLQIKLYYSADDETYNEVQRVDDDDWIDRVNGFYAAGSGYYQVNEWTADNPDFPSGYYYYTVQSKNTYGLFAGDSEIAQSEVFQYEQPENPAPRWEYSGYMYLSTPSADYWMAEMGCNNYEFSPAATDLNNWTITGADNLTFVKSGYIPSDNRGPASIGFVYTGTPNTSTPLTFTGHAAAFQGATADSETAEVTISDIPAIPRNIQYIMGASGYPVAVTWQLDKSATQPRGFWLLVGTEITDPLAHIPAIWQDDSAFRDIGEDIRTGIPNATEAGRLAIDENEGATYRTYTYTLGTGRQPADMTGPTVNWNPEALAAGRYQVSISVMAEETTPICYGPVWTKAAPTVPDDPYYPPYDPTPSNPGGSSGSSGGSGNSGGSSGTTTTPPAETTTNPDGSTTTTETDQATGTVTETTKAPDGSQTVVETKTDGTVTTTATDAAGNKTETVANPDGSAVTTIANADGGASTTTVSASGQVTASVTLPASAAPAASQAVALPMPEVPLTSNAAAAPVVTVNTGSAQPVKVEIPVERTTPGTVAVIVNPDGTETVVKTSLATGNGVTVTIPDGATVKIVDNSKSFSDTNGHWAGDAVAFASAHELFTGTGEDSFSPETTMTRAMLVTVLARYDGVDTAGGGTWYEKGADWAKSNGVSNGSDLDAPVTREQLATMLYRYAASAGLNTAASGSLDGFADVSNVSGYASEAMRWAVGTGLISGRDGSVLAPQDTATRAEVATILMRFCENVQQ